MADFDVNGTVEETMGSQQENLENLANEVIDSGGFDVRPIAIGVAAGTATIALAKPASKLAVKGAKWIWGKTGGKLVAKIRETKPTDEKPEDPKPEEAEKPADETPEETNT